jgi:hypothetical protein
VGHAADLRSFSAAMFSDVQALSNLLNAGEAAEVCVCASSMVADVGA